MLWHINNWIDWISLKVTKKWCKCRKLNLIVEEADYTSATRPIYLKCENKPQYIFQCPNFVTLASPVHYWLLRVEPTLWRSPWWWIWSIPQWNERSLGILSAAPPSLVNVWYSQFALDIFYSLYVVYRTLVKYLSLCCSRGRGWISHWPNPAALGL